jgi:hypothetical protein
MPIGKGPERSHLSDWTSDNLRKELSYGNEEPIGAVVESSLDEGPPSPPREVYYTDPSTKWALEKGYFVEILHLNSGKSVFFKAFLTDFSDTFSSNWNKEPVFGRSDPIQTFQNTERTINLAWDLVSSNLKEAKANLIKANNLIAMQYPSYAGSAQDISATSIKSGPLFKVKMGNLICKPGLGEEAGMGKAQFDGLACTMGGFQYSPSIDDGFFDPEPGIFYPQTINIDIELSILHETALGYDAQGIPLFPDSNESNDSRPGFPYGGALPGTVPANANNTGVRSQIPNYLTTLDAEWDRRDARDDARAASELQIAHALGERGSVTANVYDADHEDYGEVQRGIQPGFGSYLELQKDLMSRRLEIQMNQILSPQTRRSTIPKAIRFLKGDPFAFD